MSEIDAVGVDEFEIAFDVTVPILYAGSAEDVVQIAALLSERDARTRGQVFLEVDSADEIIKLPAPGRVVVTWLIKDVSGNGRLQRAVDAWLSEMRFGAGDTENPLIVWLSGRSEVIGAR